MINRNMSDTENTQERLLSVKLFWRCIGFYMLAMTILIVISFMGGYQLVEPLGWHDYLEEYFPDIYGHWQGYDNEAAYSVTYGWIVLLCFLQIPIYVGVYIAGKIEKVIQIQGQSTIVFAAMIFFVFVLYLMMFDTSGKTRLDFLMHESGFLSLLLLWTIFSMVSLFIVMAGCKLSVQLSKKIVDIYQK